MAHTRLLGGGTSAGPSYAMPERRYDYTAKVHDAFSATLDAFVTKTKRASTTWTEFRANLNKPTRVNKVADGFDRIARTDARMRGVSKSLGKMRLHTRAIAFNAQRAATNLNKVAASAGAAQANLAKARTSAAGIGKETATNVELAGAWTKSLKRAMIILGRILAIMVLFRAMTFVSGLFRAAVGEAFRFKKTLEGAELSVRALITSMTGAVDEQGKQLDLMDRFAASVGEARRQVNFLRVAGLKTSATFEQLLNTFQTGFAPGIRAGFDLDQIRQTVISISQAAAALDVPQNQLAEEIRSLLRGTITPRQTRIATALGITNEDVRRWKRLGTFFDELQERFEAFGVAAEAALDRVDVKLINLRDLFGQVLAEGLDPAFEQFKDILDALSTSIGDVSIEKGLTLSPTAVSLLRNANVVFQEILTSVTSIVQAFAAHGGIEDSARALATVAIVLVRMFERVGLLIAGFVQGFAQVVSVTNTIVLGVLRLSTLMHDVSGSTGLVNVSIQAMGKALGWIVGIWAVMKTTMAYVWLIQKGITGATVTWGFVTAAIRFSLKNIHTWMKRILATTGVILAIFAVLAALLVASDKELRGLFVAMAKAVGVFLAQALIDVAGWVLRIGLLLKTSLDAVLIAVLNAAKNLAVKTIKEVLNLLVTRMDQLLSGPLADAVRASGFFGRNMVDGLKTATDQARALANAIPGEDTKFDIGEFIEDRMRNTAFWIEVAKGRLRDLLGLAQEDGDAAFEGLSKAASAFFAVLGKRTGGILQKLVDGLFGIFDDAAAGADGGPFAAFFTTISDITKELTAMSDRGETADKAIRMVRATAGMRGLAKEIASSKNNLDELSEVVRGQIRDGIAQTLLGLTAMGGALAASTTEQGQRLLAQLAKYHEQLALLDDRRDLIHKKEVGRILLERNLKSRFDEEQIAAALRIATIRSDLETEGLTSAQTRREQSSRVAIAQLEEERLLLGTRYDEEVEALKGVIRQHDIWSRTGLQAVMALSHQASNYGDELEIINRQLTSADAQLRRISRFATDPIALAHEDIAAELTDPKAVYDSAVRVFSAFRDGLTDALAGAITDALFTGESTLLERVHNLAQRIAQIFLEEFIKANLLAHLFKLDSEGGDGGGSGPQRGLDIATGGEVPGGSRYENLKGHGTDTVLAALTPGEQVIQRSKAKQASAAFWEGIRTGRINVGELEHWARSRHNLRGVSSPGAPGRSKRQYASGGEVGGGSLVGGVTILNTFTAEEIAAGMASAHGQRVIVNTMLEQQEVR